MMTGSDAESALVNGSDNGTENSENSKRYFGYTKKQMITITIFSVGNLFVNTIFSLQAPFYPKEAESKGASATEYGLVIGVFQLAYFVVSPFYGYIISFLNPRKVFIWGIVTTGISTCLFGCLHYTNDHTTFITLSFVLRIIQASGDAAFVTASFTSIALDFPDCVAATFSVFESACGLGLIIGPSLGGALYEVGGYPLPFWFMATCLFTVSLIAIIYLPDVGKRPESSGEDESSGKNGIIALLKVPSVSLAYFSVFITASSVGFLIATLEPHLRQNFGLTPAITGLIFIIDGTIYALSSPLWGRLYDKSSQPKLLLLAGAVLIIAGFLLIGPAPFIPLQTTLWLVCIGLLLHGVGTGASVVSTFTQASKEAVNGGFLDNVKTYGTVSGMWLSSYALGAFVGPSAGGILLDHFGFKISSIFVLATQLVIVFLTTIFMCCSSKKRSSSVPPKNSSDSEAESLVQKESNSQQQNYGSVH